MHPTLKMMLDSSARTTIHTRAQLQNAVEVLAAKLLPMLIEVADTTNVTLYDSATQIARKAAHALSPDCAECGQPMLPPGVVKEPNHYDHAQGCSLDPYVIECPICGSTGPGDCGHGPEIAAWGRTS